MKPIPEDFYCEECEKVISEDNRRRHKEKRCGIKVTRYRSKTSRGIFLDEERQKIDIKNLGRVFTLGRIKIPERKT